MKICSGRHRVFSCAGLTALVMGLTMAFGACGAQAPQTAASVTETAPQPSEYGIADEDDAFEEVDVEAVTETEAAQTAEPETLQTEPAERPDVIPPRITGAADITVEEGGSVAYKKDVSAVDDRDGEVKFTVDNSAVDLNTPGDYPVVYSAQDAAGNKATKVITVHVTRKIATEEDFEKLHRLARRELNECLYDGMSDAEKLWTLFWHVKYNMKYVGTSDKESWVREAIRGFEERNGDCFTYYSVLKALMEEAGFETVDMTRLGGETRHFWSMVLYKDNWYHIDACPRSADHGKYWYCFLRTDAQVAEFTEVWGEGYYYVYDESLSPRTPEEPLHLGYDINGEGHAYYDEDYE